MSAAEALRTAREAGLELRVDGDNLVLQASAPPPDAVLDLLAQHKKDVVALLRAAVDDWSAEEWRAFYDERAGIAEFDGGLSRRDAEALAYGCCEAEWLNRNSVRSAPTRCLGCDEGDRRHDALVPSGSPTAGHARLHHGCWDAWHASRKAEAAAALAGMGIEDRSSVI